MQEFGFLACIQKDHYYMTNLSLEYLMHLNLSYNCSNISYNFSNSEKSNYKAVGGVECRAPSRPVPIIAGETCKISRHRFGQSQQ